MALNYAWENLYKAVHMAMQHEGSLQDRLIGCYSIFHVLDHEHDLPPDLQKRFDAMMDAWSREPDPGGVEGTVPVTLRKLSDDECRKWLEETLSLFMEVVELQAKEEQK
jgi:hypothetical protein